MPSDGNQEMSPSLAADHSDKDAKGEFLPYDLGYLTESMKLVAEKELNETEEKMESALRQFRKVIAQEKDLFVRTDDNLLLSYLRGRKYDVDRAFKVMQNAYKMRKKKSHFYDSEDNTIVHDVFRQNFIGFLPHRLKNGSVVLVLKLQMWNVEEVGADLFMWVMTHCLIHSIEDPATQVTGYTLLLDARGVCTKHLKIFTFDNIYLLVHSTLSCFPGRYKGIHVVGMPKIFTICWAMLYPFLLNTKLKKRIFVHGDDLTSLHKYIPAAILPQEFGGDMGPFDNTAWHKSILAKNEWCLEQRIYGYKS